MSIFLTKCRKIKAVLSTDWTFFQLDVFVDIFIAEIWKLKYCDVYRLLGTKKQERDFWLDRDIDRHWAGKESDEWDEKMEGVLLGLHEWGKWEKRTDGGKWISKKEAREALKRMKNGSWSSWISVLPQVWGCLGEWLFNAILKNDRISEEQESCGNCTKLISHTAKIQKRVLEENKYWEGQTALHSVFVKKGHNREKNWGRHEWQRSMWVWWTWMRTGRQWWGVQ